MHLSQYIKPSAIDNYPVRLLDNFGSRVASNQSQFLCLLQYFCIKLDLFER